MKRFVTLAVAVALFGGVADAQVTFQVNRSAATQPAEQEADQGLAGAEEAARAAEEGPPATTRATTGPASKPLKRIDKLTKAKFNRTATSALQALAAKPDEKADEAAVFSQLVIAGKWDEVGKVIASFEDEKERKKLYDHLIKELSGGGGGGAGGGPMPEGVPPEVQMQMQMQARRGGGGPGGGGGAYLLPQDVIAIISIAPAEISDEQIEPLAKLLTTALAKTNVIEPIVAEFEKGVRGVGGTDSKQRYRAAQILAAANRPIESGKFLPKLDSKLSENEPKLLELHAKHLIAVAAKEKNDELKAQAWDETQALIVHPKATAKQRDEAVVRALELWPDLAKDKSGKWFKESLSKQDEGMSVLASTGTSVSQNFMNRDVNKRGNALKQQKKLVDQLLADAGGEPARWAPALNVLAGVWMQECDYTKQRPGRRDMMRRNYGPYGYDEEMMMQQQQSNDQPPPVEAEVMLEAAPSEKWIATLDASLATRCRAGIAEMHFKNDEPAKALPIIEEMAAAHPQLAEGLAETLLRTFARVWDPNQNQRRYGGGYYYGPYGYMQQSESGIPLTRSAQNRNLAELAATLKRLAKLPFNEKIDDTAIVSAFANAHSPAEVFRVEDIETVFGKADAIERDTIVALLQTMRQRLASTWRSAQVQQQQKTKRSDKETNAEVTRGYTLLQGMLETRLKDKSDWKLMTLLGTTLFDWAEFDYGNQVDLAIYTARRDKAFTLFAEAAAKYRSQISNLKSSEQTPDVQQQWFNAALGASDLAALTRQAQPSQTQLDQIRASLLALDDKHMAAFGKWLAEAVNTLKPELKHRFLKAGIEVVGDHESAGPARKLVQYYADLLTEVELHAAVDGDPTIGHVNPFGLHVSIRHTQPVGRESGGFNKYLTNQGSRGYYYNPSGQGPVNYRDDFEKKIRAALVDRFEIQSITWYDEKVEARAFGKPGWRETPLAYVLLKPKDASVDKVPAIQMDLDFLDRQGTVILPVSSQVLLVDARPADAPPRPVEKIEITQILDQRDVANGKLTLDIKATAKGLIPDVKNLLDVSVAGFNIDKIADQGLAINSMDVEGEKLAPVCERTWLVNLTAAGGTAGAASFKFPQPKSSDIKVTYKRYADADVTDVDPQVAVSGLPLGKSRKWWWIGGAAALVIIAGAAIIILRRRGRDDVQQVHAYAVPAHVSPFNVIDLLKRIERDEELGLSGEERAKLTSEIGQLQRTYFAPSNKGNGQRDLAEIAGHWVGQAQKRA